MDNGTQGSRYWRSLGELHNAQSMTDAKANEFMAGVTDDFKVEDLSTMSRKQFLAMLSASAAFAAAGCSNYRDKGAIVPYSKKPEEVVPGVANYYASTCTACDQRCGILIKTREGRPIKIDGNPDHPISQGKTCAVGQASILDLYDPSRLKAPMYGLSSGKSTSTLTWAIADTEITAALKKIATDGKTIAIVVGAVTSPTAKAALARFAKAYPTTEIISYSEGTDSNRTEAWLRCYGVAEPAAIAWDKADVIVALESDFLGSEGQSIEATRRFASRRDIMVSSEFNRLYAVEGGMSLTGANADGRLRLRPDAQGEFILSLMNELGGRGVIAAPSVAAGFSLRSFAQKHGLKWESVDAIVKDLAQKKGKAIIVAGKALPVEAHVAVNLLNELLGNSAVYESSSAVVQVPAATPAQISSFVGRLKSGAIGAVIHVDANPAYHLPASVQYAEAIGKAQLSVALVGMEDETSLRCQYVLPVNHAFESWGDHQVRTGVLSLQQPVIAPLYDTRQKEAVLLSWALAPAAWSETVYHEFLKTRWEREVYPAAKAKADFDSFWSSSVHDGVITQSAPATARSVVKRDALASVPAAGTGMIVVMTDAYFVGDGAFANNGWLQELPHPVSKVVWDNYAAISATTAKSLGVTSNDLLEVTANGGTVKLPVFVQPGQAENTITVALGYGRRSASPVGTEVGVDLHPLFDAARLNGGRIIAAEVKKVSGTVELASTQEHHALDDPFTKELHLKREIIREGTLAEFGKDPNFLHEKKTELFSITQEVEYKGVKWAMAIDMNKCTGCNACVAGCNVENNIPVIGKDQVKRGREMHWIRIDRYYAGEVDAPTLSHQPMMCQHCDNAPCENVCPVVATNHSPDGLNQMVYNRCVGTKYCSNNCPFKVRRFNFYNFRDQYQDGYYQADVVGLAHNPEVTVRSRGVMEKCTFCVQRIMDGKQKATERGETWVGQGVTTACQDACPASAIVFGNAHDPNSAISKYREFQTGYKVLEELNVRPNVTYIAKLRNIDKEATA